ncbi:MAG: hypothetical protein AAF492_12780, partial [Verrucomicrobiota bacterium]
ESAFRDLERQMNLPFLISAAIADDVDAILTTLILISVSAGILSTVTKSLPSFRKSSSSAAHNAIGKTVKSSRQIGLIEGLMFLLL